MKRLFTFMLILILTACNLPKPPALTATVLPVSSEVPSFSYTDCGFVEARQTLPELSEQFLGKLKDVQLPVDTARAEAYGENCLASDSTVVYFTARETDFYATLKVVDLTDEAILGTLLEKVLDVVNQFSPDQTPGPQTGYIGIAFKAGDQTQNLWFTETEANDLRKLGLKGADLYQALKGKP